MSPTRTRHRRASINDVATAAGLSRGTASDPIASTVRQPADLLGSTAAELVLAQIRGLPSPVQVLDTTAVWCGSA